MNNNDRGPRTVTFLSPEARANFLHDAGLAGWVLLTAFEHGTIAQNVKAYKEERAQLVAAAYAQRDALDKLLSDLDPQERLPLYEEARAALALPLPPRPVKKPDNPA